MSHMELKVTVAWARRRLHAIAALGLTLGVCLSIIGPAAALHLRGKDSKPIVYNPSRRRALQCALSLIGAGCTAIWPSPVVAADRNALFKPNPLTNPFLEQLRIWEQAEADELKYNGELERGDAGNKGQTQAYPRLLVPILRISHDVDKVQSLVTSNDVNDWQLAEQMLRDQQYSKVEFKKTFNAFGDNIYYADPDRANLYLGGGAPPKTEQSLAYLLRNEILTNLEDLRAELQYLLSHPNDQTDTQDLRSFANIAQSSMQKYLDIVPPAELARAKELLRQQQS